VIANATITRISARERNGSSATSLSEITMISAERMKSVRIAPLTSVSSWSAPTSLADASSLWWCGLIASHSFSAPSKHRYAPPTIRIGVSSQSTNSLRISAAGRMKSSLFRSEPIAIRLITGSSRSGWKPWT
jgi:hypothetical protein